MAGRPPAGAYKETKAQPIVMEVGGAHSVRWAARYSGGLKSLWRSDEGRYTLRGQVFGFLLK